MKAISLFLNTELKIKNSLLLVTCHSSLVTALMLQLEIVTPERRVISESVDMVTVPGLSLRDGGVLADVAPTLLQMLGYEQPAEMTGRSLIS